MAKKSELTLLFEDLCAELYPRKQKKTKIKITKKLLGRLKRWHFKYKFSSKVLADIIVKMLKNGDDCKYCNEKLTYDNISLDRIVSEYQGGLNTLDNIDFICNRCNTRKNLMNGESYQKLIDFLNTELNEVERKYVLRKLALWHR